MTTAHDITIRSEAVGVGSTVSKINICPPVVSSRLSGRRTSDTLHQTLLRYEHPKPHRDTLVCSKSRHYVCTLTKLHGPNGLFIMMHDRTWVDHDHHNDDCIGSSTPSTTYDLKEHPQAWKSRLDSPLPSYIPTITLTEAHTPALDVIDESSLTSGCGHRVHNVDGVRKWHRIRAEMLRQAVEEWHQSLSLGQMLERYDMSGSTRPTARLATPSSQSSKVVQHHYTQQDCCPTTLLIRHPNQCSENGFRYVLLQINWDAVWSHGLATGLDTFARAGEPLRKEDASLETNDVSADIPHQFSHGSHHNHLDASGTTTHFDKEDPAVDTIPSSAGIRIRPLQPKHIDPRLKFPTVYEINSYKDEEGGKLLNGDQGIPLSRHPSGQVKVIRSPISERFLQEKNFVARTSINEREEVTATLDNSSTAETSSQVQEMNRYGSFYADLPEDSTPYQNTAVHQQASSSTTPLRPMTTIHTGFTTTTTPSASTPFASIRMRSPKIQPDPVIIHTHPSKGQGEHLCLGSNAVPVSRPKCRSLRTKQFPPFSPVCRPNERQAQDTNISEFLKLHQWARAPRHQQDQHITRKEHFSSHPPSEATTPQDDQVNNLVTVCLDGEGASLKRSSLRKLTSIKEEAALEKEPHQKQEQRMQRRNGKQFFEDAHCIKPEKSTVTDDLLDHQPQGAPPPQTKGGRVAERWKPCLTTISSEQVLETAESFSSPSSSLNPPTTATGTTVPQAIKRHLTHFADGHDPGVNSGSRASPTRMSTKISSAASTASGSTSPTRSSAGPTIPNRRSSGNSTLPSIASILKKPTRASCTTAGDSIDRKMSFPSMIRDPSKPQERSRLIEKGVKFVPDHAPHSVRLDKTIELIQLARLPLQDIASTATRAVAALPSPTSPIGSVFSQSTVLTCPTSPTTPTSIRSPPLLSPTTAAEQDRSSQDYQHSHSTATTSDRNPKRRSYEDIMFLAGNTTKTARDLILSPPQSTRIALMCTTCNNDFQVTDQDSLRAFAGHVMQCDDKAKGRVGKVSKSLSSSMAVPSATFQRMRTRIGERLLGRESVCDEGGSVC
ncbi:hypothetical protein EC957_004172 [Mortierella hygrophila]|uniref:Uncharacterized protein n=1 Tax=Mortierella hygrophila TaxID=979708 RepID=A0A9P6FI64_9FUNG|nr:hypothetical protein EC957_004172 [Mortierella hygrophila]